MKYKIGFIGAGKMAEGILSVIEDKSSVIMAEKLPERRAEMGAKYGVTMTEDVVEVATNASIVFLAVRPFDVAAVAKALEPYSKGRTRFDILVSIVAGKRLEQLRELFGGKIKIARVMPNLALRAKAGMCAVAATPVVLKSEVFAEVKKILCAAGEVAVLAEDDFDAVTALSGSGPAYFAYMEAAMAAAGVSLGLTATTARLLAEQTMYGTAKFLKESKLGLGEFMAGVCTPGGTTAAGMKVLASSSFKSIVAKALAAAARRSAQLSR